MKVRELVRLLQQCDQDKEVGIEDADTNWWAPNPKVHESTTCVSIGSLCYGEMDSNHDWGTQVCQKKLF